MNQRIERGDKVMHATHGEGIVRSISPHRTFAMVRFPAMTEVGYYFRPLRMSDLTRS